MFGLEKSPLHRFSKHNSTNVEFPEKPYTNPFDYDELDVKHSLKTSGIKSSKPYPFSSNLNTNPFDDEEEDTSPYHSLTAKRNYKHSLKTSGIISSEPCPFSSNLSTNPFDDEEEDTSPYHSSTAKNKYKHSLKTSGRKISKPSPISSDLSTKPFDDCEIKDTPPYRNYNSSTAKNKYKNDFRECGGLENQTMEELENYSVYNAEETTKTVNSCLKIAEGIREDASRTLVMLHHQGQQITSTHTVAADMDCDLSRGEKLLGSLGGIFSRTWKPRRTRSITGPVITRDDPMQRNGNHLEQRERFGLTSTSKERLHGPPHESTTALQKVDVQKVKQDDALSDLSNLLGELKEMAIVMGSEIDRQNKALSHVEDDVDELSVRVKGANQRTRRLLGK